MSSSFKEQVYEIAFGDNAINRDFSEEEILKRLLYFSEKSLEVEKLVPDKEETNDWIR